MFQFVIRIAGYISVLVTLAACASAPSVSTMVTLAAEPTHTPIVTPTLTAIVQESTPEPTPAGPYPVKLWFPEPLAPLDNEDAAELLSEQLSAFQSANTDLTVDYRLKKVADVGGILSTLRAASAVAPGALPDLTLLQRGDLLAAAQAGLIQPLDNRLSVAIMEDVPETALQLGQVEGRLYGVPYALDVQHIAYPSSVALDGARFEDVLAADVPFVFPARRGNGISAMLLLEYVANGGTWSGGDMTIDADALQTTLAFYESALDAGVIDPSVLDYGSSADYAAALAEGRREIAVVSSTLYLGLLAQGERLEFSYIPTANGDPVALLEGWMWVVTTSDANRQARALRLINWMLDASRQGEYMRAVHMLPSQRSVLRQLPDSRYATFIVELLPRATLPLTESESGTAARAMQSALESVLTGQRTAAEATQDVLTQLQS